MNVQTKIILGDCREQLRDFPENTFDLIVTSPPYADQRTKTYGGIKAENYVEWFLERSTQFLRVLKPTGSFVLNIKEKAEAGERHVYVLELILALRKQGWLWTEEYIWHKRNCHPGKWPNRFRDAWERCLQFNKTRNFKMFQDEVRIPMGDWAKTRLKTLGKNDVVRFNSRVGSGFGKNIANWVGRELAYPDNVLHFATECGNKKHSAAFPKALPEWFIKLFTQPGDWVLDPFTGSGTTNVVARQLNRNSVGIDALQEYVKLAEEYLAETETFQVQHNNGSKTRKSNGTAYQGVLENFCERRIKVLDDLDLKKVLKRKNPYLFRAAGIASAPEMIEQLLAAHVSSSDETIFGNVFFEPICKAVTKAPIAAAAGADFVKETKTTYEVIALKSGPNIHNSSQSYKQQIEFDKIQASLRATLRSLRKEYIPILGCGYGSVDNEPGGRLRYHKKAGQAFWTHVTGDPDFYLKMIRLMKDEPMRTKEQFREAWGRAVNRFVREFTVDFCGPGGEILWEKLTKFNSGAPASGVKNPK